MGHGFETTVVYMVDDDAHILTALSRLLKVEGYRTECYSDAETFLQFHDWEVPGCVILDVEMPGMNGYEAHELLRTDEIQRPVIFLTGRGTIPLGVQAIKSGAIDFLTKPVAANELLEAVSNALEQDRKLRCDADDRSDFKERLESLTPREHQVLLKVSEGLLNKQIAGDLGVALKTVKVHRGRVMEKMGVRSVADLVRNLTLYRS